MAGVDLEGKLSTDEAQVMRSTCLLPDTDKFSWLRPAVSGGMQDIAAMLFLAKEASFKCLYPLVTNILIFSTRPCRILIPGENGSQ